MTNKLVIMKDKLKKQEDKFQRIFETMESTHNKEMKELKKQLDQIGTKKGGFQR